MSKNEFILAIDQGTTGSTVALYRANDLSLVDVNKSEFTQIFPKSGWVEHDPEEIWGSILNGIELLKLENSQQIIGIGITNQRETVVAWNRNTGQVAGNAIVWQDRRTSDRCDELVQSGAKVSALISNTGLLIDPYFSATKMEWILKNNLTAQEWSRKNELCLGTIDSYVIFKLTAGRSFVTDHTNASRTLLYNLKTGNYDSNLLDIFGVPLNALPNINPSIGQFGKTKDVPNLVNGIPITGCLGDQQAALFGQRCIEPGQAKITFGTGAFALLNTGTDIIECNSGLLSTVAFATESKRVFAIEGSAFIAGAAVQFLRDNFGWITKSSEIEALALKCPADENVRFIPSLSGLGAPYWNARAKGVLFGLSRGTNQSQIARAVLEGIVFQNVQLLKNLEEISGLKLREVKIDGKAALNNFLVQTQADLLGMTLKRPSNIDTTATGAALAATLGLGRELPISALESEYIEFSPGPDRAKSAARVAKWIKAAEAVDHFYCS